MDIEGDTRLWQSPEDQASGQSRPGMRATRAVHYKHKRLRNPAGKAKVCRARRSVEAQRGSGDCQHR